MSKYRNQYREVETEVYWTFQRIVVGILVLMVVMYGIGFLATGGDLAIYSFWAPKQANAERKVFENTQSYVEGKIEHISRLRLQYEQAEGVQKQSLRTYILSEASTIDNTKLPADEQAFISSLKGQF